MKHELKFSKDIFSWNMCNKHFIRLRLVFLALFVCSAISAQTNKIVVSGTVLDDLGEPVIGARVAELGTTNGTSTDLDGLFKLTVAENATLEVSYLGYTTQQIAVNGQKTINVQLAQDVQVLNEVVVTALGIKREKKALGYAIQEVDGQALLDARESNVTNALSGKIAGVQVIRGSGAAGASSKIQLRGKTSVTGNNQPLIVVDGVPMDNFVGASNNDMWNPGIDMGNGLADIAAEDIASMSVLKGSSAAALYGSRAGNGVILITTKSGVKQPGLGITVSASVSAETPFMTPELQDSFGQGSNGIYDAGSGSSWGPKIEGQEYTKWNGTTGKMRAYDNAKNYLKTGVILSENISFSQQYKNVSVYTSVNRMDEMSQVPGSKLKRTNLTTRAVSKFGKDDRWTLDGKVQYINSNAENRPLSGMNNSNVFYTMNMFPRSMDIRDFRNHTDEKGTMIWYGSTNQMNPYWAKDKQRNQDVRDRFLLTASLKYQFNDWLSTEIKAGSDLYTTSLTQRLSGGSKSTETGRYSVGQDKFYENNYSFLAIAQKDNLIDKIGGAVTFGGNLMMSELKSQNASTELQIKDLFSINNSKNKMDIDYTEKLIRRKINSLYGVLQLNYGGWVFLDATFRNDWSSTLSKANRSYFFPSLSASWVISDWLNSTDNKMPSWFDFAKVRASYAEVGNSLDPYQLYNVYYTGGDGNGNTVAGPGNVLFDETLVAEKIKDYEVGAEVRFFGNRLGLDVAWYRKNATNQLLNIGMDPNSGYTSKKVNAGNIQDQGIEIMLNARPIELKTGFSWDLMFNFSKSRNTIKSLTDDVSEYHLTWGGLDNMKIIARAGGDYGEIWGTRFARVTEKDSPYYGRLIVTETGLPTENKTSTKLGTQQPDAIMGLTNTFSYKGISLSFLIDARIGGKIYSGTNYQLRTAGAAKVTAPGGKREEFVVNGVYRDDAGNYHENTTAITPQQYWVDGLGSGNLGITEANLYDATSVRLRNLSLSYNFNKSLLKKTPFQQVKVGFTANNVWMIKSNLNGVDPENVFGMSTNAEGYENGSVPTNRSFLFNVTFGF